MSLRIWIEVPRLEIWTKTTPSRSSEGDILIFSGYSWTIHTIFVSDILFIHLTMHIRSLTTPVGGDREREREKTVRLALASPPFPSFPSPPHRYPASHSHPHPHSFFFLILILPGTFSPSPPLPSPREEGTPGTFEPLPVARMRPDEARRCTLVLDGLHRCQRNVQKSVPRSWAQLSCRHLQAEATWCTMLAVCPDQARRLAECSEAHLVRDRR